MAIPLPLASAVANRLLAALPAADFARSAASPELVPRAAGWAVYEAGGTQGYVYSRSAASCRCST